MSTDSSPASTPDFPYRMVRAGVVMRPDPNDPLQAEGVLNPAAGFAPDGELKLFPRIVAPGNRSRIAVADVQLTDGVPTSVTYRGPVLEPVRPWEHGSDHGGVEDPRLTWIEPLGLYVMTYIAYGPLGPRPALLVSDDMATWERLGPVHFEYEDALEADLNIFTNKDVLWFPEAVPGPDGTPCLAFLHRPTFAAPYQEVDAPAGVVDRRPAIWISYVRLEDARRDRRALLHVFGHREVAHSEYDWESLKVGGGPPPVRVPEGWLLVHHGVSGALTHDPFAPQPGVRYAAGAMILSADDPSVVLARTTEPLMAPATEDERVGIVDNVVFPTAIVEVEGRLVCFYGMADAAIGVALIEHC